LWSPICNGKLADNGQEKEKVLKRRRSGRMDDRLKRVQEGTGPTKADCKNTLYSALLPPPTGEKAGDSEEKKPSTVCVCVSTGANVETETPWPGTPTDGRTVPILKTFNKI
jgi:hypothetical protein